MVEDREYLEFTRKKRNLRAKVFKIAAVKTVKIVSDSNYTFSDQVQQSDTIVYNRIDKAGSTTLISKFDMFI